MARPSKVDFTKKTVINKVIKLVSKGYTDASLAKEFGYSAGHFVELKKKYPELAAAIKEGQESVEQLVVNKLFDMMMDDTHSKQFSALVFYAKCKLGFNDRQQQQIILADKTTSLNFLRDE